MENIEILENDEIKQHLEHSYENVDAREALAFFKEGDEIAETWFRAISRAVITYVRGIPHQDNILLPYYCIFLNDDAHLYHEPQCYGLVRRVTPKEDSGESEPTYSVKYQESFRNDPSMTCCRNFGIYTESELLDLARELSKVESLDFYK